MSVEIMSVEEKIQRDDIYTDFYGGDTEGHLSQTQVLPGEFEIEHQQSEFDKAQKRKWRVQNCGKLSVELNPETGKPKWTPFFCDNFRDCPKCRKRRAEDLKMRIERAMIESGGEMYMIELPREDATELVRKMKKDKFFRLPQESGDDIIFISDKHSIPEFIPAKKLEYKNLYDAVHWEFIVNTPHKKRTSGGMGRRAVVSDEKSVNVKVEHVLTNAPRVIEDIAFKEAEEKTSDLNPTGDNLQKCVNKRQMEYMQRIKQLGYSILVTNTRMKKVKITRINWNSIGTNKPPT